MAGFDDAGARLLADALAEARASAAARCTLQRAEKLRAALDSLVKRGRDGGRGRVAAVARAPAVVERSRTAFEERAIEYAVAFELSPPSWEPPPVAAGRRRRRRRAEDAAGIADGLDAGDARVDGRDERLARRRRSAGSPSTRTRIAWSPIDMSDVERIDFVCAGALLNAINRVETQRKAVQIVGASPIIRALLLLIGISPRHFVKKPQ